MRLLLLFAISSIVFLYSSCEGDPGPQGPPGDSLLGQVFEVSTTFSASNDFEQLVLIPNNIEVFESDVIHVFWLENVVPDNNGGTLEVWSPLPQTIFLQEGGFFQYSFNHTFADVLLFLQGNINLNTLGNGFTNDQVFRIAIIPSEFSKTNPTIEEVMQFSTVFLQ